jgi:hypothetical protein
MYSSWAAQEAGRIRLLGTFTLRGAAMEAADTYGYPIVDVTDIGEAGHCRARGYGAFSGEPFGHRFAGGNLFAGEPATCQDCHAPDWALYIPGTAIPREPDNRMIDGPTYQPEPARER